MILHPKTWKEVSLGEVCEFKYGKSLPEAKRTGDDVPVYGSNGIVGWHNETLTDGQTIIVGRKGSFGEVNLSTVPCWPIDTTYYIDNSATEVDLKWLAYCLSTLDLKRLNRSAAIPGLNREDAYRQRLLLPPLEEQKRIADILDRAEALRAKRRAALAQLDELIQSIFLDLFGHPVISQTKWPISTLEESCEKITDGTHHSPPIQPTGIPYITAKHLKQYGLDFESDPWFVSEEDHRKIFSRCDPRAGDVLYIKDGATTGLAALNHYTYEFSMLSSLALLRPKNEKLEAAYLCFWLNNPLVKREMLGGMAGAAIQRLTLSKIKSVNIPIPPLNLQQEFACRVAAVEKLKIVHKASLADLDALFASLQYRAFRGEL